MARYIQAGKGRAVLLEEHEEPLTACDNGDVAIQAVSGGFVLLAIGESNATELQRCESLDDAFETAIIAIHFLRDTYPIGSIQFKH